MTMDNTTSRREFLGALSAGVQPRRKPWRKEELR